MDFLVVSTLFGMLTASVVTAFAFSKDTGDRVNRSFVVLGSAYWLWGCGILLRYVATSPGSALVFCCTAMFGAMLTVAQYFRFSRVLLSGMPGFSWGRAALWMERGIFAGGAVLFALLPTQLGMHGMRNIDGRFHADPAAVFYVIVGWGLTAILLAVGFVLVSLPGLKEGLHKKHALTVAIAPLGPAVILGVLEFGFHATSQGDFVGEPYFTVALFEIIIGWGVVRHGLMSISPKSAAKHIVDSMPDGLVLLDSQWTIKNANPAFLEMTGTGSEGEVQGRPLADFIADEGPSPPLTPRVGAEGTRTDLSFSLNRPGGPPVPVSAKLKPVWDSSRRITFGAVMVMRDLRPMRKMEADLVQAEKLAGLGQLAAGVAHEINNPLSVVMGLSEMGSMLELSGKAGEYFRKIQSQAERTKDIVGKLLMFARKGEGERVPRDVNGLVSEAIELARLGSKGSRTRIDAAFCAGGLRVQCEPEPMRQVFVNIIRNALEAMEECGSSGLVKVASCRSDGKARITVADNGPGIAPDLMHLIFDPFFTTKGVGKGTGLGLSICHGIVQGHNGTIRASNLAEGGACFEVELPLFEGAGEAAEPAPFSQA